jgi:hypothetical protein
MRKSVLVVIVLVAVSCASTLAAEESPLSAVLSRTAVSMGGGLTTGDLLSAKDFGYGFVLARTLVFLDAKRPSGFYIGPPSAVLFHTTGSIGITDLRIVAFGYRGAPFLQSLGLDFHLACNLGGRTENHEVTGSYYLGIQPGFGIYFPYDASVDFGVSVEPCFNIASLFGSHAVSDKSYVDVFAFVTFKQLSKILRYRWEDSPE